MIWLFLFLFVGTAQAEGWPDVPVVKCITNDRGECLQGHFMAPTQQNNSRQNRQVGGGAERIPRCFDLGDGQCSTITIYRDGTAGEWVVDKDGYRITKILADKDGNTILLECQDGAPCEYTASARHLFKCHQKMQEAIRKMKARMHPDPNSRSLARGFVVTEEIWNKEFEPLYQGCVERDR